jgi:hypothetical protein
MRRRSSFSALQRGAAGDHRREQRQHEPGAARHLEILGAKQCDHKIDQQPRGNRTAQHIGPGHFFRRSNAAQPNINARVISNSTPMLAKNKKSTTAPANALSPKEWTN